MQNYLDFLRKIMEDGVDRGDRTGTGTRSIFSYEMRFDLQKGFPLVTTKKVHMKSVVYELLWFLRGDTNIRYLNDHGVTIWDEWADAEGNLGPIYGKQWRAWEAADGRVVDQIAQLIENLKTNPHSRRHIVCAWNPGALDQIKVSPPPCHAFFQFYVSPDKRLSCKLTQRSADAFLGVPFNIASYALLTHMVAQQCGYEVGEFIWSGGDCHIYANHFEQVKIQLEREPYPLPTLELNRRDSIDEYVYEDVVVKNYQAHPRIAAPIAV